MLTRPTTQKDPEMSTEVPSTMSTTSDVIMITPRTNFTMTQRSMENTVRGKRGKYTFFAFNHD